MNVQEYFNSLSPEELAAEIARQELAALRRERDVRIAATDWWVLPDRTPTPEQLAYRQALRDITQQYSTLSDAVWPTQP